MSTSVAKEAGNASTTGDNRACSNRRCGKNKCGDGETPTARGMVSSKEPICYGNYLSH